jgi:hypothetical protein
LAPTEIFDLVIIALATIIGYTVWRGVGLFRLYWLVALLLGALAVATVGQLLQLAPVMEPANLVAIAFSCAGLASSPTLWRDEIRKNMEGLVIYGPFEARDLLSWRAWLRLVDRQGARSAALIYLGIFTIAIAAAASTVQPSNPSGDRMALVLSLAPVAVFAVLSSYYLYRGARRLVPGA